MTNAQLIYNAQILAGVTEEAHTFAHWKHLGFVVRKGEHAAFSTTIWKYAGGRDANEDADGTSANEGKPGRLFLKKAHFFTRSQVDPIRQG